MRRLDGLIIITSRADLGLLIPLIKIIKSDGEIHCSVLSVGADLKKYYKITDEELFYVDHSISVDFTDDTAGNIAKNIAYFVDRIIEFFKKNSPDFVILLGDRYELWSVALPAAVCQIPIVHINGGELTEGLIDDYVRHSITKLSSIHFPSIALYAKRIIQMGEEPWRVHTVGYIGIDVINNTELLAGPELAETLGFDPSKVATAVITYHPVTLDDYGDIKRQMDNLFKGLTNDIEKYVITMPGADKGALKITEYIKEYVANNPDRFVFVPHLGQRRYFSLLEYAQLMIGNTSSGILESASFKIPVVNIGDRQRGRFRPANVIDCECEAEQISRAIELALSSEFQTRLQDLKNPYGDGHTAERIVEILKKIDFSAPDLIKKKFFDINFELS